MGEFAFPFPLDGESLFNKSLPEGISISSFLSSIQISASRNSGSFVRKRKTDFPSRSKPRRAIFFVWGFAIDSNIRTNLPRAQVFGACTFSLHYIVKADIMTSLSDFSRGRVGKGFPASPISLRSKSESCPRNSQGSISKD